MTAVRFIVAVTSSATGRGGNRYHFATITSAKTGKQLKLRDINGPSAPRFLLSRLLGRGADINYPAIVTMECTIGVRQWNQWSKQHGTGAHYEHDVTLAMLEAIEEETP